MTFGAVGGALYRGDLISNFRDAYPSDLAERDALQRCSTADASFNKFSEGDRRNCYGAMLHPVAMQGSTANW
jgi:hypothetical protein